MDTQRNALAQALSTANPARLRILLASDLRLYRESLAEHLAHQERYLVVAVGDAGLALSHLHESEPDVILLDIAMAGGRELAATLGQTHPTVRVVALAVSPDPDVVLDCAEAGVVGYVPREASVAEVVEGVRSAANGELRCPPAVASILRQHLAESVQADHRRATGSGLTRREREIVPLLDRGLDNKAIARTLGIEVATVKNHVHNILEKLQVHSRSEAAARLGGRLD